MEHQICKFAKMILHDRCSTSYDLASLFHAWRSTLREIGWTKNTKLVGTKPSTLHSTFHFPRRMSRRNASYFYVVTSKIRRILAISLRFGAVNMIFFKKSPHCFVLDLPLPCDSGPREFYGTLWNHDALVRARTHTHRHTDTQTHRHPDTQTRTQR